MPMIWLDLKEAGDFHFHSAVKKVSTPSPRIPVACPRVTPPARLSLPGFRRRPSPPLPLHHPYLRLALHPFGNPLPDFSPGPPAFLPRFSASLL